MRENVIATRTDTRTNRSQESDWRERIRSKPGIGHLWKAGVFLVGLALIAGGFALAVLPGPLTIPPVLLGLWIWSTEFAWAHRFLEPFRDKGKEAWQHARRHPVSSGAVTFAGLAGAAAAFWAANRYNLVDRALELVGA